MDANLQRTKRPVCSRCGDSGWIRNPANPGKYIQCPCRLEVSIEELAARANIPERYRDFSLKDFQNAKDSAAQMGWSIGLEYFSSGNNETGNQPNGLLIEGQFGVGKTHLAVAILTEFIHEKKVSGYFLDFSLFVNELRRSFKPDSNISDSDLLRPVLESEIVVVDDLGSEKPSEWVEDVLSTIITHRYLSRKRLIITTNYLDSVETLQTIGAVRANAPTLVKFVNDYNRQRGRTLEQRIGPRLRSRLFEMCRTVVLMGEDRRRGPMNRTPTPVAGHFLPPPEHPEE